jgi:uncharacterized protein YfdQ (DUF2303 family)
MKKQALDKSFTRAGNNKHWHDRGSDTLRPPSHSCFWNDDDFLRSYRIRERNRGSDDTPVIVELVMKQVSRAKKNSIFINSENEHKV